MLTEPLTVTPRDGWKNCYEGQHRRKDIGCDMHERRLSVTYYRGLAVALGPIYLVYAVSVLGELYLLPQGGRHP